MQLAFRESTPKALKDIFWKLMKTDIDGPLLKVSIPSEEDFEIEQPMADLPALQRLKNYSMKDIDMLDSFDGLLSQSYSSDQFPPPDEDMDEFIQTANELGDVTRNSTNRKFSTSILDTEFPMQVASILKTQGMLKQKYEVKV